MNRREDVKFTETIFTTHFNTAHIVRGSPRKEKAKEYYIAALIFYLKSGFLILFITVHCHECCHLYV
jgi:hypothetical protein